MIRFLIIFSLLFVVFCNEMDAKKYTRQSDSLELVKFYQQTGGDNWTNNDGWRDGSLPVWKWTGVITDEQIKGNDTIVVVTDLDLAKNNLIGNLPELNLPDLFSIFVNENDLSGYIPAYQNSKLAWMDVSKNKFMIEDFMPNIDFFKSLESFVYDEQDSSFVLTVTYNANSLFFDHPYKCESCNYNWYVNGNREYQKNKDTMSHQLFFAKYNAEVYHPQLPLLKYESNEYQIVTEAISPEDNAKDIENPVLQWKEVDVADKYYIYTIQRFGGASYERYDSSLSTTFTYPEDFELSNSTITWSVAPIRGKEFGSFTKARSFTTKFMNEYTEPIDSLELVRFYNNNGGENWTRNTNWLTEKPVWQWYGVSTKATKVGDQFVHRVVKLDLPQNKIVLVDFDLNLEFLQELNLSYNNTIIKFKKGEVNLPNLRNINLTGNDIIDDISSFNIFAKLESILIDLTKIKSIDGLQLDNLSNLSATRNEITEIQNFNCPNLVSLDLSYNSIPNLNKIAAIENCDSLSILNLQNNQINDMIININLKNLTYLNLSNNQLFGSIDLINLPKLLELDLFKNNYSDIIEVQNVSKLKSLNLTSNKIIDLITNNNFHYLEKLFLTDNNLTHFNNFSLPNIKYLYLGNNKISGELQNFLKLYPTLIDGFLLVDGNMLSFEDLRTNFSENRKIKVFGYKDQKITYKYLAERIGTEYHLEPIYNGIGDRFEWISNGKVVGSGREFVVDQPIDTYLCKISYSNMPDLSYYTDSFSPLPAKIYPTKNTENVELQPTFRWNKLDYATKYRVHISQEPDMSPGSYYETSDTTFTLNDYLKPNSVYYWSLVIVSDKGSSYFTLDPWKFKTSQAEIYLNKKDSLSLVDFYNKTNGKNWKNQNYWLTDSAASKWQGLTLKIAQVGETYEYFVSYLNLFGNNLEGEIDRIDLDSLKIINLGNNNLSGTIPEFSSEVIEQIHLYDNKFEDGIENVFKNSVIDVFIYNNYINQELTDVWGNNLKYLVLSDNRISGTFPELNAPRLVHLDLGNNEIEIFPSEIYHDSIRVILLDSNKIAGVIPNIEAPLLERLVLKQNNLSGEIPILKLPRLNRLELSYNNLSGEISSMNTPSLSYLDVSHNKLSGNVPAKFSIMSNTFNISYNKFTFENISYSYIDYFSIYYYYYPQDTLFELTPIKEGNKYYLEVETEDHIQKLYTWLKNDTIIDGAKDKRVTISDLEAQYHCRVGFKTLDKLFINTKSVSYNSLTSVEDELLSGEVIISPNPAGDYISINLSSINPTLKRGVEGETLVEIYDVMGVKIQTTPVETKNFSSLQRIDVSNLPTGVYFVKIGGSNGACSIVEKFVKM